MIVKEIKLILLIVAICLLATFGVTASYANPTGAIGPTTPLLIVIALIVIAILQVEALARKAEVISSLPVDSRQGSALWPLSTLAVLLIYFWLGPHLPVPIHDYIYRIAH